MEIIYGQSQSIKVIPFKYSLRKFRFINESSDIFSDIIAKVIYGMTLVRIEFKSMKVREVFRSKDVRNSLETVRAEIQIFEILQILEVRVKFSKSVSTDCKSLEVSELRDMLSGAETAKEMIGIGINYNFLSSSKILNLERNFLDGLEHKELYRSYTSLVRTVLPHRHIGPMLHSF